MEGAREIVLHQSLTRPLLLAGAERELTLINITIIGALVFGVGLHWLSISLALLLATVGQYTLVLLGKRDPQMRALYIRHIRYRRFYLAQSSILARPQYVRSAVSNTEL